MSAFLDNDELKTLTGRKSKSHQIDALRRIGIPFYVNATGHPVVTRAAVEGRKDEPVKAAWMPRVLRSA